ncbi:unnamed protein product [Sphagnum jensenii]|uniref:Uncharacterized protein n=1 Tax=Sphagnum jensenii TaxID=128206 RepID=A0ABP0WXN1_9BRYO
MNIQDCISRHTKAPQVRQFLNRLDRLKPAHLFETTGTLALRRVKISMLEAVDCNKSALRLLTGTTWFVTPKSEATGRYPRSIMAAKGSNLTKHNSNVAMTDDIALTT